MLHALIFKNLGVCFNQPTEAIEVIIESWNSEPRYNFLGADPLNNSKRILNLFRLIKNNLAV